MSRDIETQVEHDGVGTLTLARPGRRNALSINMRDEITQQLDDWAADPAVRVVVLTGAGPTFCAGFDLNEFGQVELARRIKDSSRRYHLAVWHFPKPLVAAGMLIAAAGMVWLTRIGLHSSYVTAVLFPTMIIGLGLGQIIAPSISQRPPIWTGGKMPGSA